MLMKDVVGNFDYALSKKHNHMSQLFTHSLTRSRTHKRSYSLTLVSTKTLTHLLKTAGGSRDNFFYLYFLDSAYNVFTCTCRVIHNHF